MTHSAHLGSRWFSKLKSVRRPSQKAPPPPPRRSAAAVEGLEGRTLFALAVEAFPAAGAATDLANALLLGNTGITVLGATYTGAEAQGGVYSGLDLTFTRTRLAISDGVLLTSGFAANALGPNLSRDRIGPQFNESTVLNTAGDPDLEALVNPLNDPTLTTTDANSLTITFSAAPTVNSILFDFIFASEEFPEFIGGQFNDAFAAYLDGQLISFDPDGNPFTVDNNFFLLNNSGLTEDEEPRVSGTTFVNFDIDYDGLTPVVRTQAPLNVSLPTHTLKFVISDTQGMENDSGVFIANLQSSPQVVSGPVTDLPVPGLFTFSEVTYTRRENQLFATLTISREGGASGAAAVTVQTGDGSANAGIDYTPLPPTAVTFGDTQTTQTITIPILDDAIAEGDEDFFVVLADPTNAAGLGAVAQARVLIQDNEFGVQFLQPVFRVTEGLEETAATVTVRLTAPSNAPVTVNYATTAGGSATAGVDYTPVSGTLTFAPGETAKTFTIDVADDFLPEATETVNLTLSSASAPYIIGLVNPAVLQIFNLERPPSVTDAYFVTNERFVNGVALRFSESLTETAAENVVNYDLFIRKETRRLGGANTRTRVPIVSAVYTDISRTVLLTTAKPLRDNKVYEVVVNTTRQTGVESIDGDRIDGNYDNIPGDDFIGYLTRGNRITYFEENGDRVGLQLKGPGKFELFRTVERDARQIRMLETTPDTILAGTYQPVELTDGVATIRTLLTGTGFRNRLPQPPFVIQETLPGLAKPNT